jgi:hypothetical protein
MELPRNTEQLAVEVINKAEDLLLKTKGFARRVEERLQKAMEDPAHPQPGSQDSRHRQRRKHQQRRRP